MQALFFAILVKNTALLQAGFPCSGFVYSPQEHMDQPVAQFAVGLIPHGQVHPGFLVHDTFVMRERIEACLAVIGSHAAFSNAAEAH